VRPAHRDARSGHDTGRAAGRRSDPGGGSSRGTDRSLRSSEETARAREDSVARSGGRAAPAAPAPRHRQCPGCRVRAAAVRRSPRAEVLETALSDLCYPLAYL
jgi:hypothetical protein